MTARAAPECEEERYFFTLPLLYTLWRLARAACGPLRRNPSKSDVRGGSSSSPRSDSDAKGVSETHEPQSDANSTDGSSSTTDDEGGCAGSHASEDSRDFGLDELGDVEQDAGEDAADAFSDTSTAATCSSPSEWVLGALALQRELFTALSEPSFQEQLLELLREHGGPDDAEFLQGRQELCTIALRETLPRYGFEASAEGLEKALQELLSVSVESDDLLDGMDAIYDCLGSAPPWQGADTEGSGYQGAAPWSM